MNEHIAFVTGAIVITVAVIGTAIELHLSAREVRNERLKRFLYRGTLLLYIYFGMRLLAAILDEYILVEHSELWATLMATIGFWLSTYFSASALRRGLFKQKRSQEAIHLSDILQGRRSLIGDIDHLLYEIEQGKLTLTTLDQSLCPYVRDKAKD